MYGINDAVVDEVRRNLGIPPFRYALQRIDRIWQFSRFR